MIFESYVYKDELHKIANRIEKRLTQKRWTDHSSFLFEKDVFVACFIVRKLIEAGAKLSTSTSEMSISLDKHMPTGVKPDMRNYFEWWTLYNMDASHKVEIKLADICSAIIHSYVWAPFFEEDRKLSGFAFTSFREKSKGLYIYPLQDFVSLLRKIGDDYPNAISRTYSEEKGDYVYWAGDKFNGEVEAK